MKTVYHDEFAKQADQWVSRENRHPYSFDGVGGEAWLVPNRMGDGGLLLQSRLALGVRSVWAETFTDRDALKAAFEAVKDRHDDIYKALR